MSDFALLSNNKLKLIAMTAMLIDHTGMLLFPEEPLFRLLGRLAFPLFAFMIAEGCAHTRNRLRYLLSVAGLALPCQVLYSSVTGWLYQNILIGFTAAILVIFSLDRFFEKRTVLRAVTAGAIVGGVLFVTLGLPLLLPAFDMDYGVFGVLLPVAVYYAPTHPVKLCVTLAMLTALAACSGPIQWYALLAVPLLMLYNGQRGRLSLKYVFYVFYPLHLACLQLIANALR